MPLFRRARPRARSAARTFSRSTRRTCSASPHRRASGSTGTSKAVAMTEKTDRRALQALARFALQQHRLDLSRARRLCAGARLLREGAAGVARRGAIPATSASRDWSDRAGASLARPLRRGAGDPARAARRVRHGRRDGRLRVRGAGGDRARPRRNRPRPKPWFGKAYAALRLDASLKADERPGASTRMRRNSRTSREPRKAPRDLRAPARAESRIRAASSSTARRSSCWSPSCSPRRRPTRA